MADHSAEIARLENILNSGVESLTVDGVTTRFDFDSIRKRLKELKAEQGAGRAQAIKIRLSGGWSDY
jgi:hypothetical protein